MGHSEVNRKLRIQRIITWSQQSLEPALEPALEAALDVEGDLDVSEF